MSHMSHTDVWNDIKHRNGSREDVGEDREGSSICGEQVENGVLIETFRHSTAGGAVSGEMLSDMSTTHSGKSEISATSGNLSEKVHSDTIVDVPETEPPEPLTEDGVDLRTAWAKAGFYDFIEQEIGVV